MVFSFWEKYDDSHTVVRFATSWATSMDEVEQLADFCDGLFAGILRGRRRVWKTGKRYCEKSFCPRCI